MHSTRETDGLEHSITSFPFLVKLLCSFHDLLYDWNMQFQQMSFVLVLYMSFNLVFPLTWNLSWAEFHWLTVEFFMGSTPVVHLVAEQGFTNRISGYYARPSFKLFQSEILGKTTCIWKFTLARMQFYQVLFSDDLTAWLQCCTGETQLLFISPMLMEQIVIPY